MSLISVFLPIVLVIVILGFVAWRRRQTRFEERRKIEEALSRPIWASAEVLSSKVLSKTSFGQARVQLRLQVQPAGTERYEADVLWLVDEDAVRYLTAGELLSVKTSQLSPGTVFPDAPWAKLIKTDA
ncbi:MAG: hypothetical protein JXA13_01140 [Anaerolineales bacterium]|nr:hypothetical protein [Anaerolineales bacterium]